MHQRRRRLRETAEVMASAETMKKTTFPMTIVRRGRRNAKPKTHGCERKKKREDCGPRAEEVKEFEREFCVSE